MLQDEASHVVNHAIRQAMTIHANTNACGAAQAGVSVNRKKETRMMMTAKQIAARRDDTYPAFRLGLGTA